MALAGVGLDWVLCWPTNQSVTGSIPGQGTCLGCGPGPQLGAHKRLLHIDVSFFSLPTLSKNKVFLNIKKYIFKVFMCLCVFWGVTLILKGSLKRLINCLAVEVLGRFQCSLVSTDQVERNLQSIMRNIEHLGGFTGDLWVHEDSKDWGVHVPWWNKNENLGNKEDLGMVNMRLEVLGPDSEKTWLEFFLPEFINLVEG